MATIRTHVLKFHPFGKKRARIVRSLHLQNLKNVIHKLKLHILTVKCKTIPDTYLDSIAD